ncbi:MAG: AI-2E family transporter [Acidobacteriota bacterium]
MYSPSSTIDKSYRVAIGALAAGASVALLYYGRVFFITVIIAFIIAFLLEPLVRLFMRIRVPRGVASFLACSLWLTCLYLAGLGIYTQAQNFAVDLPVYGERLNQLVEGAAVRAESFERNFYKNLVPRRFQEQSLLPTPAVPPTAGRGKKPPTPDPVLPPPVQEVRIQQEPTALLGYAYDYLQSLFNVILMASFVPFLVYFILSWGDHLRSRLLVTLEGEARYTVMKVLDGVGHMVRAYVVGNFLLGLLLSVASSILFASVGLPYWPVVGPMSGFLSLVPYIGLPLGLLPPLVAALPFSMEPTMYLFLTTSVAMLHLFALNLLYPKFVGSRVHLNPLVVTLALMLWGMLWGGIGLLLAIPITAGLKAVCDNVAGLEPYGKLLGD